ncbi:MarR family winged helix-turn-helix transcriptional regulator [Oceanicola sp. 502str15]|uniref:MarR family winged helix-turn-helix transcriptional regulator n=1 Tax=Oceanicola sp. 502str15 TaxID=2696061 RepID=UPI0020951B06|nr:MarR family transcriptional regulator [Oceanicola sp. 502str15]MCO6383920.1 MarR family transcriptional regulator [Oceanicola sp. 502str15]
MHESDALRSHGLTSLGSRLRRLGERLQAHTQEILNEIDPRVPAASYPLLACLDTPEPRPIGDIAQALGTAQPGVTRTVTRLTGLGLTVSATCPDDARLRLVSLTPEGHALLARARATAWPRTRAAVTDLCAPFGPELLEMLDTLETRLDAKPLKDRP